MTVARFPIHPDFHQFCDLVALIGLVAALIACSTQWRRDPQEFLPPRGLSSLGETATAFPHRAQASSATFDPVCAMGVDPGPARHKAESGGQTFYFCFDLCRKDASLLDRLRAFRAPSRSCRWGTPDRRSRLGRSVALELNPARSRHVRRDAGRSSFAAGSRF